MLKTKEGSEKKKSVTLSANNETLLKIIHALCLLKDRGSNTEIVVAAIITEDGLKILKSYFASSESNAHPLDTPIVNLILHACQEGYDSKLFIVSTYVPSRFESEVIKIMRIDKIAFPKDVGKREFALLSLNESERKLVESSIPVSDIDGLDDLMEKLDSKEIRANGKGQLRTQDSFSWLDALDLKGLPDSEKPLCHELYMGLIFSSLFILSNKLSRPLNHEGRFNVAAMIVDSQNKPIAFSLNVSKSDNSIAHAELGMLLRYFSKNKVMTLPVGSRIYTTLESCEMCRAGLCLAAGEYPFYEVFGTKDEQVVCAPIENYTLEPHEPLAERKSDKQFLQFCRSNYLAMKYILSRGDLRLRFPTLFSNVALIWQQLLISRARPWVGNPMLYELEEDPIDPEYVYVREKPVFDKLFTEYYGKGISQFRIEADKVITRGRVQTPPDKTINLAFGSNLLLLGGKNITFGDGNVFGLSGSKGVRLSKSLIKEQQGLQMGFAVSCENKLIGDHTEQESDRKLRRERFKLTTSELAKLDAQLQHSNNPQTNRASHWNHLQSIDEMTPSDKICERLFRFTGQTWKFSDKLKIYFLSADQKTISDVAVLLQGKIRFERSDKPSRLSIKQPHITISILDDLLKSYPQKVAQP